MKYEQSQIKIEKLLAEPGGRRALARCDYLSRWPFSDSRHYLFRPYLGVGHEATVEIIMRWMREAGMTAWIDQAGNVVGRYEGETPGAPALLIGSHVDSVKDAGAYDGLLGVMLGLEVVEAFHREKRRFPFALEIIGFGDEEGSRFPSYMLGSRAIAGLLPEKALECHDTVGVSLPEALMNWGLPPEDFSQAQRKHGDILAYLEAHIEQASSLEEANQPLGVVSGIAAQSRFYVTITGMTGHAGTVMAKRRDALTAAAEMILAVETIAHHGPEDVVATIGAIAGSSGEATNIINGEVTFSIDLRAAHFEIRDHKAHTIQQALEEIAARRDVALYMEERHNLSGAICDTTLSTLIERAISEVAGYEASVILSQAGHDAMNIAALAPVSMLFIRCAGGISHHPAESVDAEDIILALDVMRRFVVLFAENIRN